MGSGKYSGFNRMMEMKINDRSRCSDLKFRVSVLFVMYHKWP